MKYISYNKALELFQNTDTLRSIFDMHSYEYQSITNEVRIKKLCRLVAAKLRLDFVLKGYVGFYEKEKPQVSNNFMYSVISFINKNLEKSLDYSTLYTFSFLAGKLTEIVKLKIIETSSNIPSLRD